MFSKNLILCGVSCLAITLCFQAKATLEAGQKSRELTAYAIGIAGCGTTATAKIDENKTFFHDNAEGSVYITTPVYSNDALSLNPPHNGKGDGTASVSIQVVVTVISEIGSGGRVIIVSEKPKIDVKTPLIECNPMAHKI